MLHKHLKNIININLIDKGEFVAQCLMEFPSNSISCDTEHRYIFVILRQNQP